MNKGKTVEILLVEDNQADVELIQIAFEDAKVANNLHVVSDGEEATKFLKGEGVYSDEPCPDLVLLDLNLPKKTGLEVLREMKTDSKLKLIPVVVLTSSAKEEDVLRSYEFHANSYVTKPVGFDQLRKVVQSLEDFWFTVVKLPCRVPPSGKS